MTDRRVRQAAAALALARVALGAGALALPGATGRAWMGAEGARPGTRLALRSLAGRDIALGAGLARALRDGDDVRGWLRSGVIADIGDLLASLAAARELDRRVVLVGLSAAGGAVLGLALEGRAAPPEERLSRRRG